MRREIKKTEIFVAVMLAITGFILFYVHHKIPFMMDDLWYSTNLATGERLQSFGDIIESQIWHFKQWGGRCISHGLLQLILMNGEIFADILNVVVTFLLGWIIGMIAGAKKSWAVLLSIAMMLGLNANWKMSMFWQSGAANYLYITCFVLLFLWCYLRDNLENRIFGLVIWIMPLGIVAGWSNENMGPMAWILSGLVILDRIYKKEKIQIWMILGNLSCLFGSIMVIVAPGNFVRSQQVESLEYGRLWQSFLRCYAESKALLEWIFPVMIILVILTFFAWKYMDIKLIKREYFLIIGALLSWGAMFLSPHYPDRATFGTMVLLICVIVSLLNRMLQKSKEVNVFILIFTCMIWLRGMFFLGEYISVLWGWIL